MDIEPGGPFGVILCCTILLRQLYISFFKAVFFGGQDIKSRPHHNAYRLLKMFRSSFALSCWCPGRRSNAETGQSEEPLSEVPRPDQKMVFYFAPAVSKIIEICSIGYE